jgi:cysteine-rich repeat protein
MAEATCGDGFVQAGAEDCDDMNVQDLDECNNDCASPRWVFVTSKNTDSGNLGGIAGADAYCQMFATGAGLPGTYMAWLTGMDPASAPATRFASTGFKGWYLLPTDPPVPVALGWADLTSPNETIPEDFLQSAIQFDEAGTDVMDASVWSNTTFEGEQLDPSNNCGDWLKGMNGLLGGVGLAETSTLGTKWTANGTDACNGGNRLYCFQVE